MTVASRAVMMAVMTEARTTEVEQEGLTSVAITLRGGVGHMGQVLNSVVGRVVSDMVKSVEGGSVVVSSCCIPLSTVSGGQVGLWYQLSSARCTQLVLGARMNCRPSSRTVVLNCQHTLTSESQEVIVGLVVKLVFCLLSNANMVCTPIPHCGQLNITTSTLSTLAKSGVS